MSPPEQPPSQNPSYHKQSIYFPASMLDEIRDEARRLKRSFSWVVQRAWRLSRTEMRKLPST